MVAAGRTTRNWRLYAAAGVAVACLAVGTIGSGQPIPAKHNAPAQQHDGSARTAAPGPPPPTIIQVEPTAQEVEAVAEQQAAKRRILGLDPEEWVALFTAVLTLSTVLLWLETRRLAKGADDQSEKMVASIGQAARAATAMEGVASSMADNVKHVRATVKTNKEIAARQKQLGEMQLRAYLTVVIGSGAYQDRRNNWKFEGKPSIVNTGQTAAKNVRWTKRAEILPVPIPDDFDFPEGDFMTGSTVGPHQNAMLSIVVDDYIDDDAVANVKNGIGSGLYIWGTVTYDDVFGGHHWVKYGQILTFRPDNSVWGFYTQGRNDSD